jgi:hypothetical protein
MISRRESPPTAAKDPEANRKTWPEFEKKDPNTCPARAAETPIAANATESPSAKHMERANKSFRGGAASDKSSSGCEDRASADKYATVKGSMATEQGLAAESNPTP